LTIDQILNSPISEVMTEMKIEAQPETAEECADSFLAFVRARQRNYYNPVDNFANDSKIWHHQITICCA